VDTSRDRPTSSSTQRAEAKEETEEDKGHNTILDFLVHLHLRPNSTHILAICNVLKLFIVWQTILFRRSSCTSVHLIISGGALHIN
jgi:hypothetical protein